MTDGFSSITPLWRDSSIPNVSKKHIYEYYFFVTLIFSIIPLLKVHATAIVDFSNCLGSHPLQSGQRQLLGISRSKYLARTLIDFVGRASSSFFYHIVHEPKKRFSIFAYLRGVQMKRTKSSFHFPSLFLFNVSGGRSETPALHNESFFLPILAPPAVRDFSPTRARAHLTRTAPALITHTRPRVTIFPIRNVFRSRVDGKKAGFVTCVEKAHTPRGLFSISSQKYYLTRIIFNYG